MCVRVSVARSASFATGGKTSLVLISKHGKTSSHWVLPSMSAAEGFSVVFLCSAQWREDVVENKILSDSIGGHRPLQTLQLRGKCRPVR